MSVYVGVLESVMGCRENRDECMDSERDDEMDETVKCKTKKPR